MEKGYKDLGYFFLILFCFVFLGFFKTYFGLFPQFNESTTALVHFHAFVLTLFVCILIAQPLLIRFKKFTIHRLVGKFTYVLVPLMIVSILLMQHKGFAAYEATNGPLKYFNYILKEHFHSFCDMLLLITFYSLAIANKRRVELHMRYMIATALIFVDPTLSRMLDYGLHLGSFNSDLLTVLFTDLIIIGLIYYDKKHNRSYKSYVFSLSLFLIYHISFFIMNFAKQ